MLMGLDKCPKCKKVVEYKVVVIQKSKNDAFGLPVCACGCRFIYPEKEFVKAMIKWVKE